MGIVRHISCTAALLGLCACASPEASHLPANPLMLPVHAIGAGLDNAVYGARRRPVQAFVHANHPRLIDQIRAGGGADLSRAYDLARIAAEERAALTDRLRADLHIYAPDPEALTVALMVHGG